jgi:small GTP-binding protein
MSSEGQTTFRVIVVGNSGVGKSALNLRLTDNVYYSEHVPTLGVDFKYCTFPPSDTGAPVPVRLAVWDAAGQETFLSITQQFIRGADAAFLCFDVTDTKSYVDATTAWRERVGGEKGGNIAMVLVGCKADLEGMRSVQKSEAAAWASERNLPYFETSAKENQNVRSTFAFLAKTLFDQRAHSRPGAQGGGGAAGGAGGSGGAVDGSGAATVVRLSGGGSGGARVTGPGGEAHPGGGEKPPSGCRC